MESFLELFYCENHFRPSWAPFISVLSRSRLSQWNLTRGFNKLGYFNKSFGKEVFHEGYKVKTISYLKIYEHFLPLYHLDFFGINLLKIIETLLLTMWYYFPVVSFVWQDKILKSRIQRWKLEVPCSFCNQQCFTLESAKPVMPPTICQGSQLFYIKVEEKS